MIKSPLLSGLFSYIYQTTIYMTKGKNNARKGAIQDFLKPQRNSRYKQGYFPINECKKYVGTNAACYRSSYEYKFMKWCEAQPNVIEWDSEPFSIRYESPSGSKHNYWIDFVVKFDTGEKWLVEVKPHSDTIPQKSPRYLKNAYKWTAAKQFAVENQMKFVIITEKFLNKIK